MLLIGSIDIWLPWLGGAVCVLVCLQFAFWTIGSFTHLKNQNRQFKLSQQLLIEQIECARTKLQTSKHVESDWLGFRKFVVSKLVRETETATSVYLKPQDDKPIASFLPGQYLTIQWHIPTQAKPIVRCYSLSDAPSQDHYRITVKKVPPPRDNPEAQPGIVSTYINEQLKEGDILDVKAPAGSFHLETGKSSPVVCLAGGVGITPMFSILNSIALNQPNRQLILLYGVCHGKDHIFKRELNQLTQSHKNINVINCYSDPLETDQPKIDYHVHGWVSIDILKQILPEKNVDFYMCGPAPFMQSLHDGLLEWGVDPSHIHYEAFGPASIKKVKQLPTTEQQTDDSPTNIAFVVSGKSVNWNSSFESILDAAEQNNIPIDSGCRAGNCGTCATGISKGKVRYHDEQPDCEPGKCLPCVAIPVGPIELEA